MSTQQRDSGFHALETEKSVAYVKRGKEYIAVVATLSDKLMAEIATLKMAYWPYDLSSQMRWMRDNLRDSDQHVLMRRGNDLIGYARLTLRDSKIIGVSTVCVSPTFVRQGLGTIVMAVANERIDAEQNRFGLLCCRADLLPFYEGCGWQRTSCDCFYADRPTEMYFRDSCIMSRNAPNRLPKSLLIEGPTF